MRSIQKNGRIVTTSKLNNATAPHRAPRGSLVKRACAGSKTLRAVDEKNANNRVNDGNDASISGTLDSLSECLITDDDPIGMTGDEDSDWSGFMSSPAVEMAVRNFSSAPFRTKNCAVSKRLFSDESVLKTSHVECQGYDRILSYAPADLLMDEKPRPTPCVKSMKMKKNEVARAEVEWLLEGKILGQDTLASVTSELDLNPISGKIMQLTETWDFPSGDASSSALGAALLGASIRAHATYKNVQWTFEDLPKMLNGVKFLDNSDNSGDSDESEEDQIYPMRKRISENNEPEAIVYEQFNEITGQMERKREGLWGQGIQPENEKKKGGSGRDLVQIWGYAIIAALLCGGFITGAFDFDPRAFRDELLYR